MPEGFFSTNVGNIYNHISNETMLSQYMELATSQPPKPPKPDPKQRQRRFKRGSRSLRELLNYGLGYKGDWLVERDKTKQRLIFTIGGFRSAVVSQDSVTVNKKTHYKHIFEQFAKQTNRSFIVQDKLKANPRQLARKLDWWTKRYPKPEPKQPRAANEVVMDPMTQALRVPQLVTHQNGARTVEYQEVALSNTEYDTNGFYTVDIAQF